MKKLIKTFAVSLAAATMMVGLTACGSDSFSQFDPPQEGDEIAVMKVKDYGIIKIRFFPKQAPKAVENFTGLAKKGYYDGIIFHRVIEDFMIQGGDPTGTGSGGASLWGTDFEDEFDDSLHNFTGALSMANTGLPSSNSSQFFIVQTSPRVENDFLGLDNTKFSDEVKQKYMEVGGAPWLDNKHTVFGQVFEGMDVVKKISQVKTSDSSAGNKPLKDVVIESVTIQKYTK